jgi:hypothetical protein
MMSNPGMAKGFFTRQSQQLRKHIDVKNANTFIT